VGCAGLDYLYTRSGIACKQISVGRFLDDLLSYGDTKAGLIGGDDSGIGPYTRKDGGTTFDTLPCPAGRVSKYEGADGAGRALDRRTLRMASFTHLTQRLKACMDEECELFASCLSRWSFVTSLWWSVE